MTVNYLDIIGEYYPDVQATCHGDPTIYAEIEWIAGSISQAELDAVYLTDYKTQKLVYFSELAREDIVNGFDSSALGSPHKYDSDPEDQLNLTGSVASQLDMYYANRAYLNAYQTVNLGGSATDTDPTGFANNTTTYDVEVKFEGVSTYLSIEGQAAQTFGDLIAAMNTDTDFSAKGVAELVDGNLKISSKTYGATSSVQILDADCCNNLNGYVGIAAAVPGEDPSDTTKDYRFHTHEQLLQVMQDGAAVKLSVLQKFNVKKQQVLNAASVSAVDVITWE